MPVYFHSGAVQDIYVPPGGPPQGSPPPREIYSVLGEQGIRDLLRAHYRKLAQSKISFLFPSEEEPLMAAADKSADFFIQLMGGPPLFVQKHGPPRMRARHMPFEVTEDGRKEWLRCFQEALDEQSFPAEYREAFDDFLESFSAWMVNSRGPGMGEGYR
ncbi:MAG: bacitracin resistance protein BacA [Spirochaetaceae bacterium]|nr:bacitracin resistance protein BacA [Spirochaetaceae bacterium]|tara:strand:+ start:91714 stop:92190 length:477 start_codon:yes stop_codon:yes gene_type:complete